VLGGASGAGGGRGGNLIFVFAPRT